MSPSIARKVLNSFQQGKSKQYQLSSREVEALQLIQQRIQRGVGGQSGLTYKLTGSYNASYNFTAWATHSFAGFYRLLPPNPIQPLDSYGSLPVRYSITLNSDGAITEASAIISIIEG